MCEPSYFKVEDRDALQAVMRVHSLATRDTFKLSQNLNEAGKLNVLNVLNANSESESQVMAQWVKAHALGGTA